jgi:hypothetical protein
MSVFQALGLVKDESMCRALALDLALEIILLTLGQPSQASWPDFWLQNNKGFKRSTMNDKPNERIVIPTPNDPGGHHNTHFA